MEETLRSRMGKLSSLRSYNIRFNPRPWSNPQHIEWVRPSETEQLKTVKAPKAPKIKKPRAKKVPKVKTIKQEKSFVDLHIEVASKVDELIAQMESDGKFDDMPAPSEQDINKLTPDNTTTLGETVLRK